ncbi:MAG: hypothetical protein OJF50_004702 [Nitrospira sp.]|nr:hypothetical protein [Nitrospira sp.]
MFHASPLAIQDLSFKYVQQQVECHEGMRAVISWFCSIEKLLFTYF